MAENEIAYDEDCIMYKINFIKSITISILSATIAFTSLITYSTTSNAKNYNKHTNNHHKEPCKKINPSQKWKPLNSTALSPHSNVKTYEITLQDPPNDAFFHTNMGGIPEGISIETLHAAEGSMYIVAHPDGRTDITFDFYHLLPNGIYSLWDVINTDITGAFADQPLADILPVDYGKSAQPNFFGGVEGMGSHGFRADACGQAKFTINLKSHRPNTWFLLDFHGNNWVKGGTKGVDIIPGVLWAEFPKFDS